jgi:hypothetical protein
LYRFIATWQLVDADHPGQDRLMMQLVFARNILGGLSSHGSTKGDHKDASSQGAPGSSMAKPMGLRHLAEDISWA